MNKKEKEHLNMVASLGCAVCGNMEVQIHHIRDNGSMGKKASHFETIGLCFYHHQGAEGFHTLGKRAWEEKYGTQREHLAKTLALLSAAGRI